MSLPAYFKQEIPKQNLFKQREKFFKDLSINTVCASAHCPNSAMCINDNTATFMILGNVCTRGCLFCAIDKGKPSAPDKLEPENIAQAARQMRLDYVVITSVCRDDLVDYGAGKFIEVVRAVRFLNPGVKIELLIPDFFGLAALLKSIADTDVDCVGHNLEMVPRLYPLLKRGTSYEMSLGVIKSLKKINSRIVVKTGLMLGLGEEKEEVLEVLKSLREVFCDVVVLGQYLAPSKKHFPVKRFLDIKEFEEYKDIALGLGFKAVLSAPLARSSFKAKEVCEEVVNSK